MAQRLALATAAGIAAFIVVFVGALGTYVVLKAPSASTAATLAPANNVAASIPAPPTGDSFGAQSSEQDNEESGDSGASNGYTTYPVSADQAANIALSNTPGASLAQQPRLVSLNGAVAYEVPLDRSNVYVDANSGEVLYNASNGGDSQRPRTFRRHNR